MRPRKKYHWMLYGGTITVFLLSIFLLDFFQGILSAILFFGGFIAIQIKAITIKCPICGTKVNSAHNCFSRYYDGYHFFIPKSCCKCGYNLDNDADFKISHHDTNSNNEFYGCD